MKMKRKLWWLSFLLLGMAWEQAVAQQAVARLELIPPSPVTNKIILDIRGRWRITPIRSNNMRFRFISTGSRRISCLMPKT